MRRDRIAFFCANMDRYIEETAVVVAAKYKADR